MTLEVPSTAELLERLHVVALPMRVRFRGVTTREVALIDGPAGWGEFGPFPEYDDAESAAWLRSAIEMAWQGPPAPLRDRVAVNATVPAVAPADVAGVLARFPGCTTVKVKVAEGGQVLDDDVARVRAVLDALPAARVRVDANGGWTVDQALSAAVVLDRTVRERGGEGVDYLEQPCRTVAELVTLRAALADSGLRVDVAADESIRRAEDPLRVVRAGGADRAVVKAAPLGGPGRLVALAAGLGVPVTVSSALDSAVGMTAGIAAAAALPELDGAPLPAAGLGTGGFFVHDVVAEPVPLVDGHLPVVVVEPDPARLADLAAAPGRRDWWVDRVRRCRALVG